jgi:hypothetical protein
MRGIHVTGFISCTRIFQMLVSALAPFMPSSCSRQGRRTVVALELFLELSEFMASDGEASKQVHI